MSEAPGTTRGSAVSVRLVLALGVLIVLLMWWSNRPIELVTTPGRAATTVGELTGMVGGYLICVEVLLIARIPWFDAAVGMDRLVTWHRGLGTAVVVLVAIHVVTIVLGDLLLDGSTPWGEFVSIVTRYPDMLTAVIGTGLLLLIGISSVRILRRLLSYEGWYWLHVTSYLAIYLTFAHQITTGAHFVTTPVYRVLWIALYLGTAAALLVWRLVLPARKAWRHRLRVDRVASEGSGAVSIWLTGEHLDDLGIRAGHFMLFRFLTPGQLWTAHPFSISRVPEQDRLRITVGSLGDHSRALRMLHAGTLVLAEGPFGRFTADRAHRSHILLVAGGAGIAAIRTLAEEMAGNGLGVVLLYRARSSADLAFAAEFERMAGLRLIPVIGSRADLGHDPLRAENLLALVPDAADREAFICGSPGMAARVEKSLHELRLNRRFIHREDLSLS